MEALEYYRRVAATAKLQFHLFEEVTEVQKNEKSFSVTTDKQNYHAKHIIICTLGFCVFPYIY